MSSVLNKLREVDPNNSEAVKDALSTFFQNISKHTEADSNRWLRSLENAINRFPKYCMSHRNVIETYLVNFLDCNDYHKVIQAGKCAHALQQVRPSQEKTATPKTSWRDQLNCLSDAAHALIGVVFPHAVDIHDHRAQGDQQLTNSPLSTALYEITSTSKLDKNQNKHALLATRLRNVFVFVQAMLVEIYPVAKPIRPQTVLDVVMRALSVSSGTASAGDHNLSDVMVVKTQALRTLDALIACLGANLIPFSPLVFRIVMQTLKWTSEHPSDESRKVRANAYNSLRYWLTTLHVHRLSGDGGRLEDELTNHVIADITPPKHVILLNVNAQQPTKNMSKKAKRKLANSMLLQSSISSHMPGEKDKIAVTEETNEEVALAALECLETFLIVCGLFLKPSTRVTLQERLVRECFNLESASPERALGLLHAIDACRKSVPPTVPPPTQHCLQLYSTSLSSTNPEISNFCSRALLDIRLHLHCSPPSINFAIEVQPETDRENEEKKRKMSDRNRAALEALLGKERVPDNDDDVISIPEEPSSKKPRIEEENDDERISLSSESDTEDDSNSNPSDEEIELVENVDVLDAAETETDEQLNTTETHTNIHEISTQMPLNISNLTASIENEEEENPVSMEVAYDYPNTGKDTIPVLDSIGGDNLPSTNETDDIQITCGQVVKSQEKLDEIEKSQEKLPEPKINGVDSEKPALNGHCDESKEGPIVVVNGEKVTVEDMLADFVDEVVDDKTQVTQL